MNHRRSLQAHCRFHRRLPLHFLYFPLKQCLKFIKRSLGKQIFLANKGRRIFKKSCKNQFIIFVAILNIFNLLCADASCAEEPAMFFDCFVLSKFFSQPHNIKHMHAIKTYTSRLLFIKSATDLLIITKQLFCYNINNLIFCIVCYFYFFV